MGGGGGGKKLEGNSGLLTDSGGLGHLSAPGTENLNNLIYIKIFQSVIHKKGCNAQSFHLYKQIF